MRTNLPDVFAAGDCVITHHRLLGTQLSPARHHRPQARPGRRRERPRRHPRVRRQPRHPSRQGLRPRRRAHRPARPRSHGSRLRPAHRHRPTADDHKAYYPGSHPITMRYTGDRRTGQLLGVQLVGHLGSEIAKRIDIPATAIFNQMTDRRALRPRPLLHPTARLTLGRAPDRRPSLDPIRTALTARRRLGARSLLASAPRPSRAPLRGSLRSALPGRRRTRGLWPACREGCARH